MVPSACSAQAAFPLSPKEVPLGLVLCCSSKAPPEEDRCRLLAVHVDLAGQHVVTNCLRVHLQSLSDFVLGTQNNSIHGESTDK